MVAGQIIAVSCDFGMHTRSLYNIFRLVVVVLSEFSELDRCVNQYSYSATEEACMPIRESTHVQEQTCTNQEAQHEHSKGEACLIKECTTVHGS